MHILLTDLLTCPRCGPQFGLILLADEILDREVRSGWLGCANCRERFPIAEGALDLRLAPSEPPAPEAPLPPAWIGAGDEEEAAFRLAALLGVPDGVGTTLLWGAPASLAPRVAALLPEAQVIAAGAVPPAAAEPPSVSRLVLGARLPVRDHSLRGLVVAGEVGAQTIAEARRVLLRGSRLLVLGAAPELSTRLADAGFAILLQQEGVVVASAGALR